jgi:hypothetical protein
VCEEPEVAQVRPGTVVGPGRDLQKSESSVMIKHGVVVQSSLTRCITVFRNSKACAQAHCRLLSQVLISHGADLFARNNDDKRVRTHCNSFDPA